MATVVRLGCYSTVSQTRGEGLRNNIGLQITYICLSSSGSWKSEVRSQHGQVLMRTLSRCQMIIFLYPDIAKRARQSFLLPFYKGINSTHDRTSLMISLLHLLTPSPWGLEFQHITFRGKQTFSQWHWRKRLWRCDQDGRYPWVIY